MTIGLPTWGVQFVGVNANPLDLVSGFLALE